MEFYPKPAALKKFYFLDYFYVLLKSLELHSQRDKVFSVFINLKKENNLGGSKYKRLTIETENISKHRKSQYNYTFDQVVDEAKEYNLILSTNSGDLKLTTNGRKLLDEYYSKGKNEFIFSIFRLIEKRYNAFYYLINFCYKANSENDGVLIFPIYSPSKLNFAKENIKKNKDFVEYCNVLTEKLESDISEYLGKKLNLKEQNKKIVERFRRSQFISDNGEEKFNADNYNSLIKKIRDYWIDFFLKEVYGYDFSLSSFDILIYRGKQIGIIQATEFFPNFSGRIVYPTSVIKENVKSEDFFKLYTYPDNLNLYIHSPSLKTSDHDIEEDPSMEKFVDSLIYSYFRIRETSKSYYVNLSDVKELVCYKLKISDYLFNLFLNKAYSLNLSDLLKINISLEADKLPQETNAMYLKREPILINQSYKNIIAIDLTKNKPHYG